MDKIAQDNQYRQRMMAYSEHHGVEETANRYHVCRKTVWKWSKRWDGTAKSLEEKSRRPKRSPRKQKPWEIELVKRMRKKYGKDLLLGYQKAREKGYKRSYGCFKRTAEKEVISSHALCGAYFFSSAKGFLKAAHKLMNEPVFTKPEYYVSLLYNYLLADGETVRLAQMEEYYSYGTPEELRKNI